MRHVTIAYMGIHYNGHRVVLEIPRAQHSRSFPQGSPGRVVQDQGADGQPKAMHITLKEWQAYNMAIVTCLRSP